RTTAVPLMDKLPKFTLVRNLLEAQEPPVKRRRKAAKALKAAKLRKRTAVPIEDRARAAPSKALRVGVLDLGAWVGELPSLIATLTTSQKLFTIFEVQAPVPAGLLKAPQILAQKIREYGGSLTPRQRKDLQRNVLADEFFKVGRDISESLGLDLVAGL